MTRIFHHDAPGAQPGYEYTDPSVLDGIATSASWADPEMDPGRIDWAKRQAAAAIPFRVVDGRPVAPAPTTGIRYGRNQLGHWGEQQCADAIVTATAGGHRWIVMVERSDGHGWAIPGGYVEPGETPAAAAIRELGEETGLLLYPDDGVMWQPMPARYVPDPRASDEAWMVTTPARVDLGVIDGGVLCLPVLTAADDALRACWISADSYEALTGHLSDIYGRQVFAAHRALLADVLG
ncbi:NUDIX domain-containing protein [Micromonospora rubida]|uniref:NUDIX domain-containing protein n=1 Tax=Micromonospora rubida TaxID=2697657 RepID=UPI001376E82A|nr:NUDIX domain-containing protein [Micromonospora rubida]NBE80289.1 NUDIX domain-containing protein [Micromonospora rubida]